MTAVGCSFGYPPTTTRGILSKIIGAKPVLLQSSAAVFSGMSGGLLSSDESGKPLGMLLCNTRYRRLQMSRFVVCFILCVFPLGMILYQ